MKNSQDIISDSDSSSPADGRGERNLPASVRVTPKLDDNQISSPDLNNDYTPDSAVIGSTIHPQHSKELAASAIDPLIAELNFISLQCVAPYEYLFYD